MWPNCKYHNVNYHDQHADETIFEWTEPEHFYCTYCYAEWKDIVVYPILVPKTDNVAKNSDEQTDNNSFGNPLSQNIHSLKRNRFEKKGPFEEEFAAADKNTAKTENESQMFKKCID